MRAWASPIVAAALLGGAALTAYGLVQHGMVNAWLPEDILPAYLLLGLLALAVAVVEGVGRALRLGRCAAAVVVGACIVLLAGQAGAVAALALLAAASFVLGHGVLAVLRGDARQLPASLRLAIGATICATTVGLAAHFPLAYPVT
ncbi:MAG TPA: hypothetical protein VGF26_04395, partial [Ramlibacter sp.]